jgi:hypothetical protein
MNGNIWMKKIILNNKQQILFCIQKNKFILFEIIQMEIEIDPNEINLVHS